MSLLNDMLQDLSHQRASGPSVDGEDAALLSSASLTTKKDNIWLSTVIIFCAAFVIALLVRFAWSSIHSATDNAKNNNNLEMPTAVTETIKTEQKNSQKPVEDYKKNSNPVVLNQSPLPQVPQHQLIELNANVAVIGDLLRQADRALSVDRLTAPIEDNAFGYYQKILSLDATNPFAKQGINTIVERYLQKSQEQNELGNAQAAEAYLQRAKFVSPEYFQLHSEAELSQISSRVVAPQELSAAPNVPKETITTKSGLTVIAAEPLKKTSESIASFETREASVVSVSPNVGWKDEQTAQQAAQLIQRGKIREAIDLLKNIVATEQKPIQCAMLLADTYAQQLDFFALESLLVSSPYFPEDVMAKLNAQVLSAKGDDAAAIKILEQHLVAAEKNENYRSLLASLYHKTASYQQSVVSYQRLLVSFGEKPAYWLGLALAYDGLSQSKNALQAYLRVREFPHLQAQVSAYIDQRISALRSQ